MNKTIHELNSLAQAQADDEFIIYDVSEGESKKIQVQALNNPNYSTTEQKTGGKWIDGKPIYRRVFTGILNSNSFTVSISNLSEIATQVRIDGFIKTTEPYYFTVNSSTPVRTFFSPVVHQGIMIQSSGVASSNTEYAIIFEYTKTTD